LAQIAGFRDAVDVCGLQDLGYEGNMWMYKKKVDGGSYCQVRLDRALATPEWCDRFPNVVFCHLTAAASDHCPILLTWDDPFRELRRQEGGKVFRYELMWERHAEFELALKDIWDRQGKVTTLLDLQHKIEAMTNSLQSWGCNTFGSVRKEIFRLKEDLKQMRGDPGRTAPT
jgi:hypothetical protein